MRAKQYKKVCFITTCLILTINLSAETYYIGPTESLTSLEQASQILEEGDTAIIRNGIYQQREDISNLKGSKFEDIVVMAETSGGVIYQGGTEAWHLSDCSYLKIIGIVFEGQTGNGVNIDDAGSFQTPTHHITIRECTFRDMNASGNNDQLKLSGLDHFTIEFCQFINGSAGGSGIDMVGCHQGVIRANQFENMGSNAIQAKGGTQFIIIEQNQFRNAGARSINLGGSTGLAFFRPQDAPFEAADLYVRANVFIGSDAPIAYVGSTRVVVENNTIIEPEVWIYRILQETVDTTRFVSCGDNVFRNNIVYVDNRLRRDFNIGPNTRPETFLFENNLWYNHQAANWQGPSNPGTETGSIGGQDPQFVDENDENFRLISTSPAVGMGKELSINYFDEDGKRYAKNPSIGAYETGESNKPGFAPVGAEWHYDQPWAGRQYLGYYRLEVTGDTIIDKKTAQIIDVYQVDIAGETYSPSSRLLVTSLDEKIWFYYKLGFRLLYDFSNINKDFVSFSLPLIGHMYHTSEWQDNALVGLEYNNSNLPDTSINGMNLKRLMPLSINGQDGLCIQFGDTIIEKVGNLERGLLPHPCPTMRGGHYGRLRCYSDADIHYQSSQVRCDTLERTTANTKRLKNEIQIYPNPSIENVVLNTKEPATYKIVLGEGITAYSGRLEPGKNVIDVSGLTSGFFVFQVCGLDGAVIAIKHLVKL